MSVPLLSTKLYVPSLRAGRVPRPRLIARLIAGLDCKLTLVSAPAGFGKTTLLAECLAGCPLPAAWLSLDSADNDPARFWTYLIAALQTIPAIQQAGVGRAAVGVLVSSGLTSPEPPIEGMLAGLINELVGAATPFVLVLDDLHLVTDSSIHAGLEFLLDHMPPPPDGMRLAVATRADPPWPLARLRARSQVTELRAADLRFAPDEVTTFLNGVMGLDLPPEAVSALDSRTEGWIAGLQLAGLSMSARRREGTANLMAYIEAFTGSHRFVLDYLLEEVLTQQSPAIQEFLLRTSILERMSAPVCDALLADSDGEPGPDLKGGSAGGGEGGWPDESPSQPILEQLEAANLFVVPLDEERHWYRYHHLFADLLLQRLKQRGTGAVQALHLRASAWYERQGMIPEAVGHALTANAIERVAGLVESYTLLTIFHGRLATVLGWLSALPEEVMWRRPWLSIARAWALASVGQWEPVEPLLAAAEALILQEPAVDEAQARRIMGHIVVMRSYQAAIRGELARARELAMLGLEMVPRSDVAVYGFAANLLGATLRYGGELAEAARVWTEAAGTSHAAGDLHTELTLLNALASLQMEMGRLRDAEASSQQALRRADQAVARGGDQLPLLAPIYTRLSHLRREWNDLEAALSHAREGLRLAEAWGHAEAVATARSGMAYALQATGDWRGAAESMERARQVAAGLSPWYRAMVAAEEARLWLLEGNLEAAARWARDSGLHPVDDVVYDRMRAYIVLARVLVADGRPGETLALLDRLLDRVEETGAAGREIEIRVVQALALHAEGKTADAIPVLARALFLAEPEGYMGTFLEEGAAMESLLAQFRSWIDHAEAGRRFRHLGTYAGRLRSALAGPTRLQEESGQDRPYREPESSLQSFQPRKPQCLIEPLSERELEVLHLLDTDLSMPEIADRLVVAVSTIRSHVKSIYGKLDAHGRIEAVHRAREAGLL